MSIRIAHFSTTTTDPTVKRQKSFEEYFWQNHHLNHLNIAKKNVFYIFYWPKVFAQINEFKRHKKTLDILTSNF